MKTIARISVPLVLVITVLAACGPQEAKPPPDEVTLRLKWLHQAQFTGNYVAAEKGFYADEGLEVDIVPFSYEEPIIECVVEGKADFGIVGPTEIIAARANGLPVTAFAAIYQTSPLCFYSLKESGITKPQDFVGKTVGLERDEARLCYPIVLNAVGIRRSQVNEIHIGYDATELLDGETDVSTGYIVNEPHQAIQSGYEVNTMLFADYGVDTYGDVLFATEDTINNNPELVERFLRATLEGWRYAIENKDEAIDIVLGYATHSTRGHETYMLEQSIPLIHTGEHPLGWMRADRWEKAGDIAAEQHILARGAVEAKAKTVAQQMADYINNHPNMTLKELQEDPVAQSIAVQPVGQTGFTVVSDAKTGMCYFHAIPEVVGEDVEKSREAFPTLWEIIDQLTGPRCRDTSGLYKYRAHDGSVRDKYAYLACVEGETYDGVTLFAAASAFLDEYDMVIRDIDELFTMQFLNQIYDEAD